MLVALGYDNYACYLGGELWKSIRLRVLKATPRCRCGRRAKQVHHRNYDEETMLGASLDGLLAICGKCHSRIEFTRDGKKRSFDETSTLCEAFIKCGTVALKVKKTKRLCTKCGAKARKHSAFCRPCIRMAEHGVKRFPSRHLPMCQGSGCIHQAKIGTKYCSLHAPNPNKPLHEIMNERKIMRRKLAKLKTEESLRRKAAMSNAR